MNLPRFPTKLIAFSVLALVITTAVLVDVLLPADGGPPDWGPIVFHLDNLDTGSVEDGHIYESYDDQQGEKQKEHYFSLSEAVAVLPSKCLFRNIRSSSIRAGFVAHPPPSVERSIFVYDRPSLKKYDVYKGIAYGAPDKGRWPVIKLIDGYFDKIKECDPNIYIWK